jgi:hypothetical protein
MTDKKFTDAEVIKAIGYCADESKLGCPDDCPFSEECDENVFSLDKAIVDLIIRQKAELSKKDTEIDILIRKKEALRDEIAELKAEVERLQEELKITRAHVHNNGLEWGLISIKKSVDDTKSEAIKKFAERLSARICDNIEQSDNNPDNLYFQYG